MAFFYHGVTSRLKTAKDQEGDIRYLADLVAALHSHPQSLAMLMNCLTINYILPCAKNLPSVLAFLSQWTNAMHEHPELPDSTSLELRRIIFRILGKILFN